MLVLTRKVGEAIRIGEDIEVVITSIEQNKVRVGVRSPRAIPVYREEVYKKIQSDNRMAAVMEAGDLDSIMDLFSKEKDSGTPGPVK